MLWGVTLAPHTSLVGFQLLPVRKGQEMQLRARFFSDRVRIASTLASRSSRDVFSVKNCGWRWFRLFFEQVIHRISNIFKPFFFGALYALESDSFLGPPFGQRSDSSRRKVKQRDDVRVARAHVRCCQLRFFSFSQIAERGVQDEADSVTIVWSRWCSELGRNSGCKGYAPPPSLHLDSPTEVRLCSLCFQSGLFGSAIGADSTEHSLLQNGGLQERRREVI